MAPSADVRAACRALLVRAGEVTSRLAAGEEAPLDAYIAERQAVATRLEASDTTLAPDDATALHRALELDRDLFRLLADRAAAIRAELARLARVRRSLAGYGARAGESPRFVERLG